MPCLLVLRDSGRPPPCCIVRAFDLAITFWNPHGPQPQLDHLAPALSPTDPVGGTGRSGLAAPCGRPPGHDAAGPDQGLARDRVDLRHGLVRALTQGGAGQRTGALHHPLRPRDRLRPGPPARRNRRGAARQWRAGGRGHHHRGAALGADQFDYEALQDESVAVAVGPRHALAKARRVTLAQLASCRWILYPGNMPLRTLLEREFREAGLGLPPYPIETASSLATMLMLKQDPTLVALMAEGTMAFCEEHRIARRLPLAIHSRHEAYGIVTRRGARLSPAASLLVQCLRDAANPGLGVGLVHT